MPSRLFTFAVTALALTAAVAGCGSSSRTSSTRAAPGATATTAPHAAATTTAPTSAAGALTAEAQAAAAGDIPDNQVFLVYRDTAGYSIHYPEGWLQRGRGPNVTFQDKNNRMRIVVSHGPAFSTASVNTDVSALKSANATFHATSAAALALPAGRAFKISYSTESVPNPVTNKRVTLAVDRYYFSKGGKRAILDLGAPQGVDNVDAFRLISRSFRWR